MEKPKVIIITLNYNQNDYTIDCINSLLGSDYQNFSIYLIDNGSTQQNFESLKQGLPTDERFFVERLEDNIGYVSGVNYGIKQALSLRGEYFVIMNNDTLIDKNAITALISTVQRYDDNAIVSGKVYNYDEKDTLQFIGNAKSKKGLLDYPAYVKNRREKDVGQYDKEMEMGMLDDIFWVIPKKIVQDVGMYSDYFFLYGEQTDYALRAVKQGYKLIYTPNAKLWHKGSITTANGDTKSPRLEYWRTFATLKLGVLHYNASDFKAFKLKWVFKNTIKRSIRLLSFKINFKVYFAFFKAIYHFGFWNKIRYKDNGYNPFQ